jgi:GH25 family lysozyme M1 (1,4-beta-N-acetylmuramidase)
MTSTLACRTSRFFPSVALLVAACGGGRVGEPVDETSSAVTEKCGESASGPVQGVDVSDYQGNFDWASARVQFGYAQVSDGLDSVDWSFEGNWSRMKAAGVLRGAYQFFEPDQDPTAQANMVVSKVGHLGEGDLPAMIDVEVTGGLSGSTIGTRVRTWLEVVEKGTGLRPIIYTGSYFWEDSVGTNLSSYPIWIAAYGPACPSLPADGWSNWTMWQYSDGGGSLDHDVFNGSLAQLKALSGATPPAATSSAELASSVVPNRDGRLEAFGRGTDDALWHIWQETPGGAWEGGWSSLGGKIAGDPVTLQNQDGRLEAFAAAADGAVYHVWQHTAGGSWSGWSKLGGTVTSPLAAASNKDGRLEVFALGTDEAVWHSWQTTAGGSWSGWATLGGKLTGGPAVGINEDGRLEVFGRAADDSVWHAWQTTAGGTWSGWASLDGAITSDLAASTNEDGRVEIFGLGADGAFHHAWQTKPNGSWSGWASLGGKLVSAPAVARNHDGRLEVFGRAPDDTVWHVWQKTAGGSWSGWSSMGASMVGLDTPTATKNLDGRLEVFLVGTNDALYHAWQDTPGGSWSGWAGLGGKLLE